MRELSLYEIEDVSAAGKFTDTVKAVGKGIAKRIPAVAAGMAAGELAVAVYNKVKGN